MKYVFILLAVTMSLAVVYATYTAFSGDSEIRSKAANPNCIPRGQGWSGSGLVIPDECPPETPVKRRPKTTPVPTSIRSTITPVTGYPPYPKCPDLVCLDGSAARAVDGACTCPPPLPVYEVE